MGRMIDAYVCISSSKEVERSGRDSPFSKLLLMEKKKDWFKTKSYCHIGQRLSQEDRCGVSAYIHNKDNITHHAFFPLIRKTQKKNKYKVITTKAGKQIRSKKTKKRVLCYATHFDSAIYSYYALQMSEKYEEYLEQNEISENITAYRTIAKENKKGKCNIDFAKDVFDFIAKKNKQAIEVAAITFDIKGFFDNLDHKQLKEALKKLYAVDKLDDDLYAIYKSTIKYSFVELRDLFNLFKNQIICKYKRTEVTERNVRKINYMRDNDAIAFCNKENIKMIREAHIIKKGNYIYHPQEDKIIGYTHKGIPQGLPVSAVLANIYMMDFDKIVASKIGYENVLYRRYSDDIVVICPKESVSCIKKIFFDNIKKVKLDIEVSKTNVFYFIRKLDNSIECCHSEKGKNKLFEYLGFSFDGERALLKQSSISCYYQRMQRTLQRNTIFASTVKNNKNYGKIFVNKVVNKFTLKGAKKHKIYYRQKSKDSKSFFRYSGKHSLGNYHTYVMKSVDIFQSNDIKHQLKHNLRILKKGICIAKKKVQQRIDT
jgi:hypothetical protein